ncbi:MAG: MBL fold metallo-hydrolase, partial [Planctomycetota bacterium]|nr:MBL fold metallo-hydrolase [Planctomycetota bacterium]
MAATLTVLGAGSILPRIGYGCAGYALRMEPDGPVTLLDCGPGTVRTLAPAGIALADVRRVVFSHYHIDHCLDVVALAFGRRNPAFEPAPLLELFGPVGLAKIVTGAPVAFGSWGKDPNVAVTEIAVDAEGRGGFEADGATFTCVRTGHTAEAIAWRADLPSGVSVAYTGDTGENLAVAELARG